MLALITGGSGSGKSAFAESLSVACHQGEEAMIYIATMFPFDEESHRRIARHRQMRKDKNFETVECFTHLSRVRLERPTTVLLECMSNLTANEVFQEDGAGERTVEAVLEGVERLAGQAEHLLIVSNELFSDGIEYDPETDRYLRYLGEINRRIAGMADLAVEVVYGIPLCRKGGDRPEITSLLERAGAVQKGMPVLPQPSGKTV